MKLLIPIITAFLFINNVQSKWIPKPGTTWNYLIASREIDILNRPEEVLTIDLNNSHLIPELHKQGKKVVCYFSGGTIESHRDDKDQYLAHKDMIILGETKWHELWLDYRMKNVLYPLIKNRMKIAAQNGCDGVEIDCIGAYNHEDVLQRMKNQGKEPLTKEDAYNFAVDLSKMAHELGLSIGLKNVATLAKNLVNYFDFAVVESCSRSSNVCGLYEDFPKQGKAVFTIHYGNYGSFQNQIKTMIKEQKNLGYTCTFNNDNNLDFPGFSYDCDNGSTLNGRSTNSSLNISTSSSNSNSNSNSNSSSSSSNNKNINYSKTKSKTTSSKKSKSTEAPKVNPNYDSFNTNIDTFNSNSVNTDPAAQSAVAQNVSNQSSGIPDYTSVNATDVSYTSLDNFDGSESSGSFYAAGAKESLENYKEEKKSKGGKTGKTIAIVTAGGVAVAAIFVFIKKRKNRYDNAVLL